MTLEDAVRVYRLKGICLAFLWKNFSEEGNLDSVPKRLKGLLGLVASASWAPGFKQEAQQLQAVVNASAPEY